MFTSLSGAIKASTEDNKKFYTPPELAKLLGISESLLNKLRIAGNGPKYNKISHRTIRYSIDEVEKYLESCKRASTSDTGGLHD